MGRSQTGGNCQARFKALCRTCPLRERCTTSKTGRTLTVHPQHALLTAARRAATYPDWQDEYRRWRPGRAGHRLTLPTAVAECPVEA
ncbi:transposase [Streptomyces sp. NPDC046805]|uniref:transposase n=1 Tax=Streptomyces sp. NPDC046805 TaxID=3155134 RepID=UPI0033D9A6BB